MIQGGGGGGEGGGGGLVYLFKKEVCFRAQHCIHFSFFIFVKGLHLTSHLLDFRSRVRRSMTL